MTTSMRWHDDDRPPAWTTVPKKRRHIGQAEDWLAGVLIGVGLLTFVMQMALFDVFGVIFSLVCLLLGLALLAIFHAMRRNHR